MIAVYEPSEKIAFASPFENLIIGTKASKYFLVDVSRPLNSPIVMFIAFNANIDVSNHISLPEEDTQIFTGNVSTREVIQMNYLNGVQKFRLILSDGTQLRNAEQVPKTELIIVTVASYYTIVVDYKKQVQLNKYMLTLVAGQFPTFFA